MVWTKIKEEYYNWETKNQTVEGVLINSEPAGQYKNKRHTIENETGMHTFWGNQQLDNKLEGLSGKKIKVTLLDLEHQYPNGKGKMFEVQVWTE